MTNETVVLLFDRDAKGRVSLTEHMAKKPFVKHHQHHHQSAMRSSNGSLPTSNGHSNVRR